MAVKTYPDGAPFAGEIGRTADDSSPAWPAPRRAPQGAPNILFFVLDDVGFGQLSPFGGLVEMPVLDKLAGEGLRYTNMHTTSVCSPSRACVLTGRNHHSVGIACITEAATGYPGYNGMMPFDKATLPEMLLPLGYNTFCVGKCTSHRLRTPRRRARSIVGRLGVASSGTTASWAARPTSGTRS